MIILNFTPHIINIFDGDVQIREIPSNGLARVSVERTQIGLLDGIPVFISEFGAVEGLPKQIEFTVIIVSRMVFTASNRTDLICVDDTIRDDQGRIIGCRAFSR